MTNLEDEVKCIFLDTFPNLDPKKFDWDLKQKDFDEWDSLAGLNLITLTETKFNLTFTIDDAVSITCARELLEYIKSKQ